MSQLLEEFFGDLSEGYLRFLYQFLKWGRVNTAIVAIFLILDMVLLHMVSSDLCNVSNGLRLM